MVAVDRAKWAHIGLPHIWKAQTKTCFYCRRKLALKDATRDHLLPRWMGYSNLTLNMVVCCKSCNQAKGSRLPTFEETAKARNIYRALNAPAWAVG